MKKTLLQFIIQTFLGTSGEASAKRITAAYFTVALISALHASYIYHMIKYQTLELYIYILSLDLAFVALLLGLATMENLTSFVRTIKGNEKYNNNNLDSSSVDRSSTVCNNSEETSNK